MAFLERLGAPTKPLVGAVMDFGDPLNRGANGIWLLNEGSGTFIRDLSPFRRHGIFDSDNGASIWSATKLGACIDFNGGAGGGFIDLPKFDIVGDNGSDDGISASAWIKTAATIDPTDQRIFSKASSGAEADHWWMLGLAFGSGGDRVRVRLKTGGSTVTHIAIAAPPLLVHTLYFIAFTYDGTRIRIYLDGREVFTTALTGTVDVDSTVDVNIARNPGSSPNQESNGFIDVVRLWNRGLSANEITRMYANAYAGIVSPELWFSSAAAPAPSVVQSHVIGVGIGEGIGVGIG